MLRSASTLNRVPHLLRSLFFCGLPPASGENDILLLRQHSVSFVRQPPTIWLGPSTREYGQAVTEVSYSASAPSSINVTRRTPAPA